MFKDCSDIYALFRCWWNVSLLMPCPSVYAMFRCLCIVRVLMQCLGVDAWFECKHPNIANVRLLMLWVYILGNNGVDVISNNFESNFYQLSNWNPSFNESLITNYISLNCYHLCQNRVTWLFLYKNGPEGQKIKKNIPIGRKKV